MNAPSPPPASLTAQAVLPLYLQRVADCLDGLDTPDALALFLHAAPLDGRQIAYLVDRCGVPPLALMADGDGVGWPLLAARVEFLGGRTPRFAWRPDDGAPALVTVARDRDGIGVDVLAMSLREGWVASLDGVPAMAGEQDLDGADAVAVHADAAAWLRDGRSGVVVLDRGRAVEMLRRCRSLVVSAVEQGDDLLRAMRPRLPKILVEA